MADPPANNLIEAPPRPVMPEPDLPQQVGRATDLARALGINVGGGGSGGGYVPQTVARLENIQANKDAALDPIRGQIAEDYTRGRQRVAQAESAIQPVDITAAPKPQDFSLWEAFGSPAMLFSQIASAFTGAPAVTALNAAAGAINAQREGDWRKHQLAYREWKDATELALKRHEMQSRDLTLALESLRDNIQNGNAMMQVYGAKYGDQAALAMQEAGLYHQAASLAQSRDSAAASMKIQMLQLVQQEDTRKAELARLEYDRAHPTTLAGQQALAVDDLVRRGVPREQAVSQVSAAAKTVNPMIALRASAVQQLVANGMSLSDALKEVEAKQAGGLDGMAQNLVREYVANGMSLEEAIQKAAMAKNAPSVFKTESDNLRAATRDAETQRHNSTLEALRAKKFDSEEARNAAVDAERERHNRATEETSGQQFYEPKMATVEKPDGGTEQVFARQNKRTGEWFTADGSNQKVQGRVTNAQKPEGEVTLSPDAIKGLAEQYLAGDRQVIQGLARTASGLANKIAIENEVFNQAKAKGMTGRDLAATIGEFQGFFMTAERTAGARSANIEMAANEAAFLLPQAEAASKNVSRTNYPTINSILMAVERGTGDESVVKFAVAINALASVYARAINPVGEVTDTGKRIALDLFEQKYSQGQFQAVLDQVKLELEAARRAPGAVQQQLRQGIVNGPAPHQSSGNVAPSYPQPPPAAVARLKGAPGEAAQFDETFGPGAAKRALGQ